MNRRTFLGSLAGSVAASSIAAPALIRLARKSPRPIAGGFVDDGSAIGHRIRDRAASALLPQSAIRNPQPFAVVIVGSGIAGLSAAWELERRGMRDFVVLELEQRAGGNARWGENGVSSYPWAAHYVPVPDEGATLVRELFRELGVLRGGMWEERYLCASPQERLYIHGAWRPGIEPEDALDRKAREEFRRFDALVQEHRASGEFTIPLARGVKRDSPLDRLTMAEWMRQHDLSSSALRWYVDYACRDDYGALARDVSAWAGVHYFAARAHDEQGPLTWPEGNGWIVKRLLAKLDRYVKTGTPVLRVERGRNGRTPGPSASARWRVVTPQATYLADTVIFAAPGFVAPYIVEGVENQRSGFVYSPWLTANLTLERLPADRGTTAAPLAWDNVIYDSPALGYVVADHQSLRSRASRDDRSVWTYYWSLAELEPRAARELLARQEWAVWRDRILADLARAHPDIGECVSRIDVMRHGHAMIRPTVGFLNAPERRPGDAALPALFFANSDRSGLSLFEEAQYQGVTAARRALALLG